MYIKIANLSDGEHYFEFIEDVSKIGLTEPFYGALKADVKLTKSHSQIIIKAEFEVKAKFECDRCTAGFNTALNTSYQVVYFFSKNPAKDESVDLIYISPDADIIDISKEVRDYALLAVPMKKLCSDDCKGLCFNCGKDLNTESCNCAKENIDPRWEPLLKLKKN
jgi:uncharacterized protein